MKNLGRKTLMIAVLLGMTILAIAQTNRVFAQTAEVRVVNPDTGDNKFSFILGEVYPEMRFNVTVWAYDVSDVFAFQVYMVVNDTWLKITNAWLPTWDPEYVFYGQTPVPVAPSFYDDNNNGLNESVLVGASLLVGTPFTGSGLLAVIEVGIVNVTTVPLSTVLNISYTEPFDTYLLDSNLNRLDITKTNGICSFEDLTPPVIGDPIQEPATDIQPGQDVKIMVNVTDDFSGVKNVTLLYSNDTVWYEVPMIYNSTTELWEGIIPGFNAGINVKYQIEAYDNAGNKNVNDNEGEYYVYTVVPELTSILMLLLLATSSLTMYAIRKKQKAKL